MDMCSWYTFCDHVTPRFKAAGGWLLEFRKFLGGDHWGDANSCEHHLEFYMKEAWRTLPRATRFFLSLMHPKFPTKSMQGQAQELAKLARTPCIHNLLYHCCSVKTTLSPWSDFWKKNLLIWSNELSSIQEEINHFTLPYLTAVKHAEAFT